MLKILTPKEFSLLDTFIVIFQIQHAVAMCCLKKLKKKKNEEECPVTARINLSTESG